MSIPRTCEVSDCTTKIYARKFCLKHYYRWKRHGDPSILKIENHGLRNSSEYNSWFNMKTRCLNKNNWHYKYYGGRGITICEDWLHSFTKFHRDMGKRPTPQHTLERRNVEGNYEASNCYWATKTVQSNNKRNNIMVTSKGRTRTLSQWCKEENIGYHRVYDRIYKLKWSPEQALELD